MSNKLTIIGGSWRSRVLTFPDASGLRPTPARVRETLFNWLQYDLAGSHCLDLYAGSGALGFEAASRGAAKVVQVELNSVVVNTLMANKAQLAADAMTIVQQDVATFLQQTSEKFNVIFLDPPFANNLIAQTCQQLEQRQWLSATAKIYIESAAVESLTGLPDNWHCLKQKRAGKVSYQLYRRSIKQQQ